MEAQTENGSLEYIIRIRGIPWACSKEAVEKFFSNCAIKNKEEGIHFVLNTEGKQTGEAYIEFESTEDVEKAKKKNRNYIGSRYIEVFEACRSEMEHFLSGENNGLTSRRKNGGSNNGDIPFGGTVEFLDDIKPASNVYVRLRGLPFNCRETDIFKFFEGLEIVPHGIKMPMNRQNKSVGEAFIQFATILDAEKAMAKHKEKIGHRYIEVFRSNPREFHKIFSDGNMPPHGLMHQPPSRFQQNPWMDGYGPRPPYGSSLLPRPPPPRETYSSYPPPSSGGYNGESWEGGPPSRSSYDEYGTPSNSSSTNPYFEGYQPPWMRDNGDYSSNGPTKTRPPPSRPAPYELPDRFHFYKSRDQQNNNNDHNEDRDNRDPGEHYSSIAFTPPASSVPYRGSDHFVFVRGLPFHIAETDIERFFSLPPASVTPTFVKLILDDYNRPTEAKVEFASHEDAMKAMEKDKTMLFNRSVDLFMCSKEVPPVKHTNGSAAKNYERNEPAFQPKPSNPKQVFGSNYSYNVPPANGSQTQTSSTAASSQPPTNEKNFSFYGMVPEGWRSEFSLPVGTSQPDSSASASSNYNYGYSNPYYGYGNAGGGAPYGYSGYSNYSTAPAKASTTGLQHTIRKEPINYS